MAKNHNENAKGSGASKPNQKLAIQEIRNLNNT